MRPILDPGDKIRQMSVGQYLNQHSFTVISAMTLVALAVYLFRDGIQTGDMLAFGALALGLGLAYFLFRPGASTETDPKAVLEEIGAGDPVLLEFQSPY